MATIKIHLLNSRVTTTTYNDVSMESPNNYHIIAGEKNATQFEIVYDQEAWSGYTFSLEMVNSKGYSVEPPTITNNTFTLPNGMATAGYGYIGIKAEKESETVTFMPVKVKVWNYVEAWKGNVIDRNITFQEFVDLENRVEDLEQNGTGGGSVANAVTTDTAQTITGEKTFTQPIFIQDASYEDPYATHGLEIHPHKIVHYEYYIPEEDGFKGEFTFPEGESGTIATQEFVQEYLAENGGGSSADVGEIQFCCYYKVEIDPGNFPVGRSHTSGYNTSWWTGTPVVGQYVMFKNGVGKITYVSQSQVTFTIIKIDYIVNNGLERNFTDGIYAPITAGNRGDILVSDGYQAKWESLDSLTSFAANVCMVTYEAPEEMAMIMYTLYGNYTGGYVYTLRDAYNLIVNAVGENVTVPASGIWMDTTTGNQANVLAVAAMDGMFVAITSDMQQHIIDLVGEGEDYFAQLDFVPMPMGKTFDDSDNLTEGGEGEW